MKISVIIPVYNVEKYLHQCVDSVLNQTYKDIEVILVDDGSTDTSGSICDTYKKKDHRVQVIHKKNGGLSSARNAGVQLATGEYGLFVDSDDYWLDSKGLEKCVQRCKNTDILSFGYTKYIEDTNTFVPYYGSDAACEQYPNKEEQLEELTKKNLFLASACDKMIRLSILKDMPFKEGMVSEDVEWCCRLLKKGNSFDFINLPFYVYRQRSGSISHTITSKNCIDLKNAILGCARLGNESYIQRYTAYQFSTFIAVQAFTTEFQNECIKELEPYVYVLKEYGTSKKVQAMYIGTKVFGLKNWCRIIKMTKGIWDRLR